MMIDRRFERAWFERGKLNAAPVSWLDRVGFSLLRFRAWLLALRQAKCSHEVCGDECSKCGWPFRILNVYTPRGFTVAPRFLVQLRRALPPGVKVITLEGAAPHLGLVGFELPPAQFLNMQSALGESLRAAP